MANRNKLLGRQFYYSGFRSGNEHFRTEAEALQGALSDKEFFEQKYPSAGKIIIETATDCDGTFVRAKEI